VALCAEHAGAPHGHHHIRDEAVDPDAKVAKQLGIHIKSLIRWDARPGLNFPKPIYINGRKYRRRREVQDFLRRAAVAHASKP
jgi:hypothetical protein